MGNVCSQLIGFHIGDSIWGVQEIPDAIDDIHIYNSLNIYPNPATHFIQVDLTPNQKCFYSLWNVEGKLILSGELNDQIINLENIKSGFYFLKISCDKNIFVSSFVKN